MYLQFILNVNINVYFCNFPPGNTNIKFDLSKKKHVFNDLAIYTKQEKYWNWDLST